MKNVRSLAAGFLATASALIAVAPTPAGGQCVGEWMTDSPINGVSGIVSRQTTWDPDGSGSLPEMLVVSANGMAGHTKIERLAMWDGSAWHAIRNGLSHGPGVQIRAMIAYRGELIVGGTFSGADGQSSGGLARWDGATWRPVGGVVNNVIGLAAYSGELIAMGDFISAGGVAARRIARWGGATWRPLGTGLEYAGFGLSSMTVYNGDLIVAGTITSAGGVPVSNIARWDGSAWSAMGEGSDKHIRTLTVHEGSLYFGATWVQGGPSYARIARWNGASWETLGSILPIFGPWALLSHKGDLLLNELDSVDGVQKGGLVRWTASGWEPLDGDPESLAAGIWTMGVYNGDLVVGGQFESVDDEPCTNIARWDGSAWHAMPAGTNRGISTMMPYANGIIASGPFTTIGGVRAGGVAYWDGAGWQALGQGMTGGYKPNVVALTNYRGLVVAGGVFEYADGEPAKNIAMWDGEAWRPLAEGLTHSIEPNAVAWLAVLGDDLIAAVNYTTSIGRNQTSMRRWDGEMWHAMAEMNGAVLAMKVYNDELYIAGHFTRIDGVAIDAIARWDGTQWRDVGGPHVSTGALCLEVQDGTLVAAAGFPRPGGSTSYLGRWDGVAWSFPPEPAVLSAVTALGVYRGDLLAGLSDGRVQRWDGVAWSPIAEAMYNPLSPTTASVETLLDFNDQLVIAVDGVTPAARASAYFARWAEPAECRADLNGDGVVDFADYLAFLNAFDAGETEADMNCDGVIDFGDYLEYLNLFEAGC